MPAPDELEKTKVGEAMINKPSDEDKKLFIKNWIENIPKTLLVKYFKKENQEMKIKNQ